MKIDLIMEYKPISLKTALELNMLTFYYKIKIVWTLQLVNNLFSLSVNLGIKFLHSKNVIL